MVHKSLIFMVRPGWLEHPTYGFVVRHSIQLSYGRKLLFPPHPDLLPPGEKEIKSSRLWDKGEKRELHWNYSNPLKYIQLFLSRSIPCNPQLFHGLL